MQNASFQRSVIKMKTMKTTSKLITILFLGLLILTSCSNNDDSTPSAALVINSISPIVGDAGTVVTINGQGFENNISDNTVTFNGFPAMLNATTQNQLQVTVPIGATTGAVSVSVAGDTEQGPVFTIDERLKFMGDYENEDYDALFSRVGLDTTLTVNSSSDVEIKLIANSTNEIEVDIRDFLEDGLNNMLGSSLINYSFDDDIIAIVDGDEFEIEEFDFTVIEGSFSAPAEFLEGEGKLEDGVIVFSFRYIIQADDPIEISAEDVELEM